MYDNVALHNMGGWTQQSYFNAAALFSCGGKTFPHGGASVIIPPQNDKDFPPQEHIYPDITVVSSYPRSE